MTKKKLIGFIMFIVGGATILIMGEYNSARSQKVALNYEIMGKVEKIKLDMKKIPTITVNSREYYLNEFGIPENSEIQPGDSIYKESKGTVLKHYRKYNNGYYLKNTYQLAK